MQTLNTFIEFGSTGIDAMAVALIVGTFLWGSIRFLCKPVIIVLMLTGGTKHSWEGRCRSV